MLLFLALYLEAASSIPIPQKIEAVSHVQFFDDVIGLLDERNGQLWVINHSGKVLAEISQKGRGPGEFIRPFDLAAHESGFVLTDLMQRKILFYSPSLAFIRDHEVSGLPRMVAGDGKTSYLVMYDPINETMIQPIDPKGAGFGLPLPIPKPNQDVLMGSQAGCLLVLDERLYYTNVFRPHIQVFTSSGQPVENIKIPGIDPFEPMRSQADLRRRVIQFLRRGERLVCTVKDQQENTRFSYIIDPKNQRIENTDYVPGVFADSKGQWWQLKMDDDYPIRLDRYPTL